MCYELKPCFTALCHRLWQWFNQIVSKLGVLNRHAGSEEAVCCIGQVPCQSTEDNINLVFLAPTWQVDHCCNVVRHNSVPHTCAGHADHCMYVVSRSALDHDMLLAASTLHVGCGPYLMGLDALPVAYSPHLHLPANKTSD